MELHLTGYINVCTRDIMLQARENISQVEFTPRFTAVLVFEETPQFDWTMKYYKDDIISFTVWDNEKRMQGKKTDSSVIIFDMILSRVLEFG